MKDKFSNIRVNYEDGLFDYFTNTTLDAVIDYLKEDDIFKEVESITIYIK